METTTSPAKSGLIYGVIFGIIMILEFVIIYSIGLDTITNKNLGFVLNIFNYVIFPIAFITIGCNNYKNKFNGGFISFSDCLKIGVSIAVIAGLVYAIFTAIFNMIFPEFVDEMINKIRAVSLAENPDIPAEQLEIGMSWTKKFMSNPAITIPVTLLMYAFIGLIFSLIVGAFVKKDQPQQSF